MVFKDAPHTRAHHGVVISNQDTGHAKVHALDALGPIGKGRGIRLRPSKTNMGSRDVALG